MLRKFFQNRGDAAGRRADVGQVRGIDPSMNYCPGCADEFRPRVDYCPLCRLPLRGGEEVLAEAKARETQLAARSMVLIPGEELVLLRQAPILELKGLRQLLAREGIPALLSSDEAGCGRGCGGAGVQLLIREADISRATRILAREFLADEENEATATVLVDQSVETLCPACQCRFPTSVGACPECGLCFG